MLTLLKNYRDRRHDRLRATHMAARRPGLYAPYSVDLFRNFLAQVQARRGSRFLPFSSAPETAPNAARWYLRYDIDTADCAKKMHLLLDASHDAGLPAAAFFLLHGNPYDLASLRPEVEKWRARGVEIGLHTCCYAEDDFLARFREETRLFTEALGFAPRSFTVHGMGKERYDVRVKFYETIATRYAEFGYTSCDVPAIRNYDHVFTDCHSGEGGKRCIYDDLVNLPDFISRGRTYTALLHPCYWQP